MHGNGVSDLGPLEVVVGGQSTAIASANERALLALLLLEPNRVVSAERLADALWGEGTSASGPTSLRLLISRVRRTLAAVENREVLVTRPPGYVVVIEPGALDTARFDALAARGRAQLDAGDTEGPARVLREALEWPGTLRDLTETATRLCDRDLAAATARHLRPFARQLPMLGRVLCLGAADRYLGMAEATMGNWDEAEAHYEVALAMEQRLRSPVFVATTRYWYGRMLLDRAIPGDRDRAAQLLHQARTTAEELGMALVARESRELLDTM